MSCSACDVIACCALRRHITDNRRDLDSRSNCARARRTNAGTSQVPSALRHKAARLDALCVHYSAPTATSIPCETRNWKRRAQDGIRMMAG